MNFISENILNLKNILSFWPVFCFKGSFLMTFTGKETSVLQRMVTRILFIILKIESNSNIEKNGEIVICVNLTWMVKYHAATKKHVCKEFLMAWKLSKKMYQTLMVYIWVIELEWHLSFYFECLTNSLPWDYVSLADKVKHIKVLQCLQLKGICTPYFSPTFLLRSPPSLLFLEVVCKQ